MQYIQKGQQTRVCPRCRTRLKCKDLKIFEKAQTLNEAVTLVRHMKTPNEVTQRMAKLTALKTGNKTNEAVLFGKLLSELLKILPKALPENFLLEKANEMQIPEEYIAQTLSQLNQEGLVIFKVDNTKNNTKSNNILQFPSLPFKFGKIYVAKP